MSDPFEWFTNPEHEHIIGLDALIEDHLRIEFGIDKLQVDCGVEGKGPYTYHFRIRHVDSDLRGRVHDSATDMLSAWTPYRFEVQCI